MIYCILNFVFALVLFFHTYYTDKKIGNVDYNPLVVLSLILAGACFAMSVALYASFFLPVRLALFLLRLSFFLFGAYALEVCIYFLYFPSFSYPAAVRIVRVAIDVLLLYFVFTQIQAINVTNFLGMRVSARYIFTGMITMYYPYTLFHLYCFLLGFFIPAICAVVMQVKAEATNERLPLQKSILNVIALVASWFIIWLLMKSTGRVPLFITLFPMAYVVMQILLVFSITTNTLFDFFLLLGGFLKMAVVVVIPSLLVGALFPVLWPIYRDSPRLFIFAILLVVALAITVSYQLRKLFNKVSRFRSVQYEGPFEHALSKMDYNGEPEEIVRNMQNIFKQNLGLSEMRVLIENGHGELESVYDEEGQDRITIDIRNSSFDQLLNSNRNIILRSVVENGHTFVFIREALEKTFRRTHSDAIILLNEGRRISGALLLGPKAGGNIYNDYDYSVFSKLYSYFFVFGYYMKNIGNQAIVGTVNREIRMSSQIINSIQRNMDKIKNKSYDTGYIMVPSHNIGGEFIDFIKLSPDRHIIVLGDLSGKGISASMSMVIVKSIVRSFLNETKDFKQLVQRVNEFIRDNLPKGTFFEGFFGLLDFSDKTLYYINCGTPALFLYTRSYNNVIEIQGEGRVLGFVRNIFPLLKVKKVKLNPGDVIVACTDGLIDARSLRGEVYGKDRIQKSITENTMYPATKMAQSMYDSMVDFLSTEIQDDVSILVLKCL